ncbi:DUF1775 domain-containing protein [Aquipuribacter sp. MA13-6]|uniref:DUF1775 domain-containing protein n=1 Tax=unclassified Aquipuribacter TaxID=2635084 RepID=UPI003EEA67CC
MSARAPQRSTRRRAAGTLSVTVLAAIAWSGAAAPASAHVSLVSAVPDGDGTTSLTFELDHGCDGGQGTTGLDLTAAAGVTYLEADAPDGWTAAVSPTSVRWDGPTVPDGDRVELTVRAQVLGRPGDTVHLPVVQRCEQDAAYAWVDTDPGSETPAPSMVLTAAVIGDGGEERQAGAGPLGVLLTIAVGGAGLGAVGVVATRSRPASPGRRGDEDLSTDEARRQP